MRKEQTQNASPVISSLFLFSNYLGTQGQILEIQRLIARHRRLGECSGKSPQEAMKGVQAWPLEKQEDLKQA